MVFYAIISFLCGIFVFEYTEISFYFLLFLVLISIYLLFYFRSIKVFLLIIFFILGIIRINFVEDVSGVDYLVGKNQEYSGIIINEPDKRENNTHYVIFVEKEDFIVRATLPRIPELEFNQRIVFKGKLEKPEKFKNENEIEFDYPKFLAKDGIGYVMFNPQIVSKEENVEKSFYGLLFELKSFFVSKLQRELKSPQSGLAAGILVGSKQLLGKELLEDFRIAGLIHLVVLSGYNVTIIADAIKKVFSVLPLFYSKFLSIIFIICFAILTGASATTIRASIMAIISVIAFGSSRKYEVNRALWVAAFLMVLHNPKILAGDPGFQLSFLATLGLLHINQFILNKIGFVTNRFQVREILSTTISTQIAVLPLIIKMTGEISVVAIISNILVLPTMPIAMLLSAITGVFSFLNPISKIVSYPAYILLSYIIFIAERFSELPFAVVKIAFNNLPV